jgi:hypothetical protein
MQKNKEGAFIQSHRASGIKHHLTPGTFLEALVASARSGTLQTPRSGILRLRVRYEQPVMSHCREVHAC